MQDSSNNIVVKHCEYNKNNKYQIGDIIVASGNAPRYWDTLYAVQSITKAGWLRVNKINMDDINDNGKCINIPSTYTDTVRYCSKTNKYTMKGMRKIEKFNLNDI